MRLLIDEALQQRVAELLAAAGHDAVHAVAVGMQAARDRTLLERARKEGRVVVTTDTDFGMLLALSGEGDPSVILLRGIDDRAEARAAAIAAAISSVDDALGRGAVAVIEPSRIRIRELPIRDEGG